MQSPPIDPRRYTDLVVETEQLVAKGSSWQPALEGLLDPGATLIRIFGHFAELVVDRLNRAPARNQLAFLNLIGASQVPPQPARVPLTFTLARGSPSAALIPAGTLVGARPLPGETDDVVFETERDLVVTRSVIGAVFVSDTETDTYSDRTAAATGQAAEAFEALGGDLPSPHHLYLAVEPRTEPADITLELRSPDTWQWSTWPIVWEYWDGDAWRQPNSSGTAAPGAWVVALSYIPELPAHAIDDVEAGWVRGRLAMPLPPGDAGNLPEWVAVGNRRPQRFTEGLIAFGETAPRLYLSADESFATGGAQVRLQFRSAQPGTAAHVELSWWYHDGDDWRPLGQSSNRAEQLGATTVDFSDGTLGLTRDGEVTFQVPMHWPRTRHRTRVGRWLRIDVSGGGYRRPPRLAAVESAHEWKLPHLSEVWIDGRPPLAVRTYNDFVYRDDQSLPFVPTTDEEPALYLAFDRPFEPRPVGLHVCIEPPRPEEVAADELAEIDPAAPPVIAWEYEGPDGWRPLGAEDETQALTVSGLVSFAGPRDFTKRSRFGQARYWIRARWVRGSFPVAPRLRRVLLNTVWAADATTITDAIVGSGNGKPGQVVTTARSPVLTGQRLTVREHDEPDRGLGPPTEQWVEWDERPDFYASGPRDRHYTVDRLTGQVRFGDGMCGMIPPTGQSNIRITYRAGGGERGNREAGTIVELKSAIPYVEGVVNHVPAEGGAPLEPIERLAARAPRVLRHRDRAITADDLEDLAMASPAVARARAVVPAFNPSTLWLEQGATATDAHVDADAGRVGVVVVPNDDTDQPTPSFGLLRDVQAFLRARGPDTAEVWVAGPEWIAVRVDAVVMAVVLAEADAVARRVRATIERFLHPLTGGPEALGWAFGRKPHRSDLLAVASDVEGVEHIDSLSVSLEPETKDPDRKRALQGLLNRPLGARSDRPELDRDLRRWLDRALVYSGAHHISVAP